MKKFLRRVWQVFFSLFAEAIEESVREIKEGICGIVKMTKDVKREVASAGKARGGGRNA